MARAFVDDRWLKNDEDGNPPSILLYSGMA